MKRLFCFVVLSLCSVMMAGEYRFENITAVQRWPWDNLVDIEFDMVQSDTGRGARLGVEVEITATFSGKAYVLDASTLQGNQIYGEGRRKVTWNPVSLLAGRDLRGIEFSFKVVRENLKLGYMIVDLKDGTYEYQDLSFSNQVNTAKYKTRYMAFRYIPATTSSDWYSLYQRDTFTFGTQFDTSNKSEQSYYGASDSDILRAPSAKIRLTKGFFIGVFPMTRAQYAALGNTYAESNDMRPMRGVSYSGLRGDDKLENGNFYPRETFVDANTPIGQIRKRSGLAIDLPSEFQWEYACRAGSTGEYFFVENPYGKLSKDALYSELRKYCSLGVDNDVGYQAPNPWGLYDLICCVHQWTTTLGRTSTATVDSNFVIYGDSTDPQSMLPNYDYPQRITRGSHFNAGGVAHRVARSAYRYPMRTGKSDSGCAAGELGNCGCRLALTLDSF